MDKRYFEFSEGTSNKFWEIWGEGSAVKTRYGKIGASGQTTIKDEGDAAGAQKLYVKLITEKTKKGYLEKRSSSASKPAPAPAKVVAASQAKHPVPSGKALDLKGKTVVVTGTFSQPRKQLEKRVVDAGATLGGSVTAKTDYLVVGADAGSKLAAAQKLGVALLTEDQLQSGLSAAKAASDEMPSHDAPTAQWQVYADQLQERGDPRGHVIALQFKLGKKADPELRAAEREAIKPLLTGPLVGVVAKFDALVEKLKANERAQLLAYFTHDPAPERTLRKVEQAIGAPLHPSIATFFRQTNGLQLYAQDRENENFDDSFVPLKKYDPRAISRFQENYQVTWGLDIPPIDELFLTTYEGQLWFDHHSDDDTQEFGRKSYPQLSFHKSLRVVDRHNGYYVIGAALIDQPGNPKIGLGDDYGVDWDSTKTVDFETFITTVLAKQADTEKIVSWLRR